FPNDLRRRLPSQPTAAASLSFPAPTRLGSRLLHSPDLGGSQCAASSPTKSRRRLCSSSLTWCSRSLPPIVKRRPDGVASVVQQMLSSGLNETCKS
ncbi:hypothetical protein EJB05_12481, partial [Eragrostis curvula]